MISLNVTISFGQKNDNLFVIMAYVDNYDRDSIDKYQISSIKDYQKIIFKIVNDTLVVFDTLNIANDCNMKEFVQFEDNNFFYFEEKNMFETDNPNYFSILDYEKDSIILRRYNSDLDNKYLGYMPFKVSVKIDNSIYIYNEWKQGKLYGKGINRYFEKKELQLLDFQNVFVSGISSPFQKYFGFSYYYPFGNLEKLKITIGLSDYNNMLDTKFQIPIYLRDSTINKVGVVIHNDNYLVVGGQSSIRNSMGFNNYYYWIFNKSNELVDTLMMSGFESYYLKNYRDFLYGTSIMKRNFWSMFKDLNGVQRDSIIQENKKIVRGKYNDINGKNPYLLDKVGRLFFYHIPSGSKFYIETDVLDSELLTIQKSWIYYRVYDEIRKIKLDEINCCVEYKTDELVLKNKGIVPFVHHIFFSKSLQKNCKEIFIN